MLASTPLDAQTLNLRWPRGRSCVKVYKGRWWIEIQLWSRPSHTKGAAQQVVWEGVQGALVFTLNPHMTRGRSFGKVYKGRWRGGTVAIKVLEHGGSMALQVAALRESLLCKNIMHPNIVRILACAPAPLRCLRSEARKP